jgi:hypothetical protein
MQVWEEVLLYGFLGYIFLHLLIVDALRVYRTIKKEKNMSTDSNNNDQRLPPTATNHLQLHSSGEHDLENGSNVIKSSDIQPTLIEPTQVKQKDHLSDSEEHLLEVMVRKVCDTVVSCVLQYLITFQECWKLSLQCLNDCMLAYINLLQYLVEKILDKDIILYVCGTACIITGLAIVLVYVSLHFYHN